MHPLPRALRWRLALLVGELAEVASVLRADRAAERAAGLAERLRSPAR